MDTDREVKRLMNDSLVYERAYIRAHKILTKLLEKKNKEDEAARQAGETPDESLKILTHDIARLKQEYREESDKLWKRVDELADPYEAGYERLAQAIIENAAHDYEAALCGGGNASEQLRIELFSKYGAEAFTTLDFPGILARIKSAYPKFVKKAKDNVEQIIAETEQARKEKTDTKDISIKCPLCGYGMYCFGKPKKTATIKCTNCAFQAEVPSKHENKKR